jgi:hypothetical protein
MLLQLLLAPSAFADGRESQHNADSVDITQHNIVRDAQISDEPWKDWVRNELQIRDALIASQSQEISDLRARADIQDQKLTELEREGAKPTAGQDKRRGLQNAAGSCFEGFPEMSCPSTGYRQCERDTDCINPDYDTASQSNVRCYLRSVEQSEYFWAAKCADAPEEPEEPEDNSACKYDVVEDGAVNVPDLLQVLASFHLENCVLRADFNGDCVVNVADLLLLLAAFGGDASAGTCQMAHVDFALPTVSWARRWLQTNREGRTTVEISSGPPAVCTPMIAGAVYFDLSATQFFGCSGVGDGGWSSLGSGGGGDISAILLGLASQKYTCAEGWGSEAGATYQCNLDVAPPVLQCEAGTVSVQAARNAVSHTLTPADIPRPTIFDTNGDVGSAPDYGGTFVELLQDPTLGQDPVSMITWTRPYFIEGSFAQVRVII